MAAFGNGYSYNPWVGNSAPIYNGGYQAPSYSAPYIQQPQNTFQQAQVPMQPQQQPAFTCCPVTSREEAVAYRVEAFGPAALMPDLGHGMIYYKRFNPDTALADFGEFKLVIPQKQDAEQSAQNENTSPIEVKDYSEEFSAINQSMDRITEKINALLERTEARTAQTPKKAVAEK